MFFPISDDQVQGGHKPIFAYTLIGLNILVFMYQVYLPLPHCELFIQHFGLQPVHLFHTEHLYSILTHMFLHGGWMHLIGNMVFLWVFADNIEAVIGTVNFIGFYIIGGICAAVLHALFQMDSNVPMVGASGAISAVMGAYLVMFPQSKIRVFVLFFLRSVPVPAVLFLGFWIFQQFTNGIATVTEGTNVGGVAWWAHIGGFLYGIVLGYFARKSYR